ncbi:zinc ribbon domain-containing protein [Parachitinimonas caeni]|uniref:Zinc ribbon domain-containing protein n=1 Tax=Parachitinimonas caeni TaxID=3031301 RepID=A0ABT7DWQ4_9NEIS|nr:zinc ribbon domain-containing protein [Parachitinimonas caeni]MDK2124485.1 zinc ribbon domain-containing protein [Parachitinimonas caeni]
MKLSVTGAGPIESLIYEYGIRIDKEHLRSQVLEDGTQQDCALQQQFWQAHHSYNAIVAQIRDTLQAAIHWLERQAGPEVVSLRQQLELVTARWKEAKAADDRESLKKIATERQGLWKRYYELMHAARKTHSAQLNAQFLDQLAERKGCPIYTTRCQAVDEGLGWATANLVIKSAIQAFRKTWPRFKLPRFHHASEIVQQMVELQFASGAVSIGDLLAGRHSEIKLLAGEAGSRHYYPFEFRIGAGERKQQITGTLQYHRPLPEGAKIQRARLIERRIGKDRRYYLQFSLHLNQPLQQPVPEDRQPLVALDFGWYYDEDDGRRIAGKTDNADPGLAEILRLPPELDQQFDHADELKSRRDALRDELVPELRAVDWCHAPEPIAERLAKIKRVPKPQYVAPGQLAMLVLAWRQHCPDYLPDWLARLEAWRQTDRLLWQASSHLARRTRNARRKLYQQWALDLARRYEVIVIDTPDLEQTAKVKDEETGAHNKLGARARAGRVRASLYELRQALEWAAARHGTIIADIKGRTSKTCAYCQGKAEPPEPAARAVHCQNPDCGAVTDREHNAAAVCYQQADRRQQEIRYQYVEANRAKTEALAKRADSRQKRQQARWKDKDKDKDDKGPEAETRDE